MELYPKECVFERNCKNLNLLLLLQQRRQGLFHGYTISYIHFEGSTIPCGRIAESQNLGTGGGC